MLRPTGSPVASRLLGSFAAALATGCFGGGSSEPAPIQPTLVAVEPADFLGTVPCAPLPGALQSYVATFHDVSGDLDGVVSPDGFALPSSGPVDCARRVGTNRVIVGRRYAVDVQGYDRPSCSSGGGDDCLRPLSPGLPLMVDARGEPVSPRWTSSCGRQATVDPSGDAGSTTGVRAAENTTVLVRPCTLLGDATTAEAGGVSVDLTAALGSLECGAGAGQIERFDVTPVGGGGPLGQADCGDPVLLGDLPGGSIQQFTVRAYQGGSDEPAWATVCQALVLGGTTVDATCDVLSDQGALRVDLASVFSDCSELARVTVTPAAETGVPALVLAGAECQSSLVVPRLPAGPQAVTVAATPAGPSATCTGTVSPAAVIDAACSPESPDGG